MDAVNGAWWRWLLCISPKGSYCLQELDLSFYQKRSLKDRMGTAEWKIATEIACALRLSLCEGCNLRNLQKASAAANEKLKGQLTARTERGWTRMDMGEKQDDQRKAPQHLKEACWT